MASSHPDHRAALRPVADRLPGARGQKAVLPVLSASSGAVSLIEAGLILDTRAAQAVQKAKEKCDDRTRVSKRQESHYSTGQQRRPSHPEQKTTITDVAVCVIVPTRDQHGDAHAY